MKGNCNEKNNGYQTSRNSCNSTALAAMCVVPVSATTTTTGVPTPPAFPTLTYTGFMMKANMHLTDLTGVASTNELPVC